ncbi:MAG: tubulin-like doman-containing protein [Crocosphaera sp.]|nr:tubulin-like doman-containing protein [Crocosphaera sp.]
MTQATNARQQFRGINRTICIGLGGTGLDILMRVRRSIVNRYGHLNNLPIVSFVHIDTDKSASLASSLRTGNVHHGVDLSLKESEKVSTTMSAIEVENFKNGLERRSSYDRQGPYDHISLWFPTKLLGNIKAIEDGAKAIRPVGRLAFFHNYRKIKTVIDAAERRTRGHQGTLLKSGIRVNEKLNIFVVGSLCGGTGSGMFLDMAYSLRHDYSNQGAQIVGYLVIAPTLYTQSANPNPTIFANTYAALKELNHYSTPGTQFNACYDIQNVVVVQEERPPFDYAYLVSDQTSNNYKIIDKRKLCNVIASKIALDFSGELAPVVKGQRDNFAQHLLQWDDYPRPNIQRYLAFGLAAIYFPRDLIVRIALTRISHKLVLFWLSGYDQSPDPQKLLEEFLFGWHTDLIRKEGFTYRLESTPQEVNKTFSQAISNWRSKLEGMIDECKSRDDRVSLTQKLPKEFRDQFRRTQPGETENTRGIWLTRVQQVRPTITKELKQDIDQYLERLLTPSSGNFSIKSSRDWLDTLTVELDNHQHLLEEDIQNYGGMRSLEALEKKWRDTKTIIDDIEKKFNLLGNKNREIQEEARNAIRQISQLIEHNFKLTVAQEALEIVKELQQYVQDSVTQLAGFYRLVDNLASDYEKEEEHWKQLDFDEMSGEAIFDNEDIESCYQELLPDKEYREQLIVLSKEITEASGRGQSLVGFIERNTFGGSYTDRITQEQIQQDINLTIDRLFGSRSLKIVKSVIKRFLESYSISERSHRFSDIRREAEPLLSLDTKDPYFRDTPAKKSDLVGFHDTNNQEVQNFKQVLTRDLAITENILKSTQAEDEILLVTEYAGFPLRLIDGLSTMRQHYMREKNVMNACLHNENDPSNPFIDIIPPDVKTIEKLEDIFYPCLAFKLLRENFQAKQLEFDHYDQIRDRNYTASLSLVWNQALETMSERQDLTAALEKLLRQAEMEIEKQSSRWYEHYLPRLREFVDQVDQLPEDDPNYPYKSTVVGNQGTTDLIAKEGVIIRFERRMREKVKKLQSAQETPNSKPNTQQETYTQQGTSSDPNVTDEVIDAEIEEPNPNQKNQQSSTNSQTYSNQNKQSNGDFMTQLKELKKMKEDGVLNDEEFEIAKRKLLGT